MSVRYFKKNQWWREVFQTYKLQRAEAMPVLLVRGHGGDALVDNDLLGAAAHLGSSMCLGRSHPLVVAGQLRRDSFSAKPTHASMRSELDKATNVGEQTSILVWANRVSVKWMPLLFFGYTVRRENK